MQAFLQKKRNEDKAAQEEIKNLSKALERYKSDFSLWFQAVVKQALNLMTSVSTLNLFFNGRMTRECSPPPFCCSLHRRRTDLLMDTMVQVILKQGQVEVTTTDPTADNADTDFMLYHRSVVDNLRNVIRVSLFLLSSQRIWFDSNQIGQIQVVMVSLPATDYYRYAQTLAEQKITSMVVCKDVRKGMIQLEWENKVMRKQIEDLYDKEKNIKMLRLSEEQQKMTVM